MAFVRWPLEAPRAYRLRELGLPRILLVEPDGTPPIEPDPRQDWIRVPFDEADLLARVRTLELRCVDVERPRVQGDGRLTFAGRWISVSRINERLLEPLTENYGDVVSIDDLVARGWPDGQGRTAMLRVHVVRLRRVIAELGLQLVGVRERGYVLEAADQGTGPGEKAQRARRAGDVVALGCPYTDSSRVSACGSWASGRSPACRRVDAPAPGPACSWPLRSGASVGASSGSSLLCRLSHQKAIATSGIRIHGPTEPWATASTRPATANTSAALSRRIYLLRDMRRR